MSWQFLAGTAVLAAALAVASAIDVAMSEQRRAPLPALLALIAAILASAAVLARRAPGTTATVPQLDLGRRLILVGGLGFILHVFVRLLAARRFGGHIGNFDFGTKCDRHGVCERNLAFTPEPETIGHFVQGCGAALLFPSCAVLLRSNGRGCCGWASRHLPVVEDFVALGVVVYPVYNTAKRAVKTANAFATSSYCSNGAEWGFGFLVGICLAWLADVVAARAQAGQQAPEPPPAARPCLSVLRLVAGTALYAVALLAGVLAGLTWCRRPDGSGEDDTIVQVFMTMLLLACPLAVSVAGAFGVHRRIMRWGLDSPKQ